MALDLLRRRLHHQRLTAPVDDPAEVVRALGAVQAQDYRAALWAVALRTRRATEADVERALTERAIVRTWPMRGTLHFVAPEDVRWMVRTLAPRVIQRSTGRYRQLGLDKQTFARARRAFEVALVGGRQFTRPEMFAVLERAGISPEGQRGIHILGLLSMEAVLCLGGPRGKQSTFTLLDEWIPTSRVIDRDEALAELARRYFASHGPASVNDFAWWTGLPLGEARRGVELAGPPPAGRTRTRPIAATAFLLPSYDEYTVAYRERRDILDPAHAERTIGGLTPVVVLGGKIAGTWRRRIARDGVELELEIFARVTAATRAALTRAAGRYGRFLGLTPEVTFVTGTRG